MQFSLIFDTIEEFQNAMAAVAGPGASAPVGATPQPGPAPVAATPQPGPAPVAATAQPQPAPVGATPQPAPQPAPATAPVAATAQPAPAGAVDAATLQAAVQAFAKARGAPAAKAILAQYGHSKVTDIPAEQLANFMPLFAVA